MKKKYIIILLALVCGLVKVTDAQTQSQSQTQKKKHTNRYYNSWRLGLNLGAMWETSDVRRGTLGTGGGFTLEKAFCENETNFLSFAIKGRGLWGSTYGLDYARNYSIQNDPSLNGKYNPGTNYDSLAAAGGASFILNNYKTKIAEGALEFQICFNSLREKTNVLLNLWGGIGFTSYRTKINVLSDKNKMYNYFLVDSSGSQGLMLSSHKFLLDDSYESYGNNSQNGNVLTWSPSCGVGLGYRFNDYISLIWEYKLTFPQGTYSDYLDGIEKHNNDWLGCNKDYYHYTGLNMTIRLGGKGGHSQSSTNVNNYTNANTNTVVTINPTTSVVTTQPPAVKPVVNITNPPSTPFYENVNTTFPFKANVYNVSQRNQLYVTYNGSEIKNYTWSGQTIAFSGQLNPGNNVVSVTATNTAGSDSKSAIVVYSGVPPQITITTPGNSKYTSTQSSSDVYATILNVESASYISVVLNGQPFSSFSYNPSNKVFAMNTALVTGTNTIDITATNAFGKDNKTQLIIYQPTATIGSTVVAAKPVTVVITDPSANPYTATTTTYNVKAKVTGVNSQSQVTVTANGNNSVFNYLNGNVDFNVSLLSGNNSIQVSAKNGRQADSKSTVIVYNPPKKVTPPTVVIINPNPSPYTTNQTNYAFKAQTTYITDKSQLEVKYNNVAVYNYNFDAINGIIDFYANLILNTDNLLEVKATNVYGSANASAIVKIEMPKQKVICHKVPRGGGQETMTINESDWPEHQAHGDYEGVCKVKVETDATITICHMNADGSKQTISILQSQWVQHQAHGDVMGNCPKVSTENPLPDPDITICHLNANGSKQTIVVKQSQWAQHQSHGDVMGACPKLGNEIPVDPLITICHKNADGTETKMTIPQSQWASHQAHGDYVGGECATKTNTVPAGNGIVICHKNNDGSTTTMTIPPDQWPVHRAHGDVLGACATQTVVPEDKKITICHIPPGNNQNPQTIEINESAWPAHQAHGDTKGACPTPTVVPEDKKITICHIPPGNNQNPQTIEINESAWPAHQAHGDTKGACPTPTVVPEDKKITICHIPPGNNQNPQTIEINESAWPAHQAHGDTKGACPTPTVVPEDKKITICHIPPGNNQNPQTIEINESAWPAHQAHGDTKGACPTPTVVPEDKKITICHIPPGNNQNPQTIEINESAWPAHQAHGDTKGACQVQKTEGPGGGKKGGEVKENDGGNGPGRTNQTQTTEPQKTEEPKKTEETIKLKPR